MDIREKLLQAYDSTLTRAGVSGDRLARRLAAIAAIGKTEEGGSCRIGYSREERAAKEQVGTWMREAGLTVREDEAGNIIGRLEGAADHLPAILSGSHVDTVPNGGHFDGVLGVLAALEVVEAWKETGYRPRHPFEVVIFSDEEGARFHDGLTGSLAMTGEIDMAQQLCLHDLHGDSFASVIESYGLHAERFAQARRDFRAVKAFIEVHIEQGKRLEKHNVPVGVVTGIAGLYLVKVTFEGIAGHAGNTPMDDRHDPLVAAGRFVYELRTLPEQVSSSAVATTGKLDVFPNGINVIPQKVELYVDVRDIHAETLAQLVALISEKATAIAEQSNVTAHIETKSLAKPAPISETMQAKLSAIVARQGIEPLLLPSGAGHDAMILAHHTPIAMLFVRSQEGISHNPREWSSLNDCAQAIHVLREFVESLQEE